MKFVIDSIGDVVDSIRKTGTFTVSDNTNGVYTMSSRNELKNKEWVTINGSEYKVYDVTSTEFKIETTDSITDGSYKTLAPYYMYGHKRELNNRLLDKNKDNKYRYQKYPLIALRMPFTVKESFNDSAKEVKLNIAFAEFTEKEYQTPERYEKVITPILTPLYEAFEKGLEKSVFIPYDHDRTDIPYWGSHLEKSEMVFSDPLDAIEINNLSLKFNQNC